MHRVTRSNECTGICNMNHTKPHNSIHVCCKALGEELVLKETGKKNSTDESAHCGRGSGLAL